MSDYYECMEFYAGLLEKYVRHVINCEGCSYIDHGRPSSDVEFTEDEIKALTSIEEEWQKENRGD